jgi:hypothetical protein
MDDDLCSETHLIARHAGNWRSRGSWDAIPKPVSHTLLASSTTTFAGLISLCIRPCLMDLAE